MKKLILTLTAAALFVPAFAVAKQRAVVEDCLKGKRQTQSCYTLIANYWQHAPTIERVARDKLGYVKPGEKVYYNITPNY